MQSLILFGIALTVSFLLFQLSCSPYLEDAVNAARSLEHIVVLFCLLLLLLEDSEKKEERVSDALYWSNILMWFFLFFHAVRLIIEVWNFNVGFKVPKLKKAGYKVIELKHAGFQAKEMKDADFSCEELSKAGFKVPELKEAGFQAKQLKENFGFQAKELKDAGFSCEVLSKAGFEVPKLKEAGFQAKEMKDAGFSYEVLRSAGFNVFELDFLFIPSPILQSIPLSSDMRADQACVARSLCLHGLFIHYGTVVISFMSKVGACPYYCLAYISRCLKNLDISFLVFRLLLFLLPYVVYYAVKGLNCWTFEIGEENEMKVLAADMLISCNTGSHRFLKMVTSVFLFGIIPGIIMMSILRLHCFSEQFRGANQEKESEPRAVVVGSQNI